MLGDWQLARDELEQANEILLEKFPITGMLTFHLI